jgi:hypothetical protein
MVDYTGGGFNDGALVTHNGKNYKTFCKKCKLSKMHSMNGKHLFGCNFSIMVYSNNEFFVIVDDNGGVTLPGWSGKTLDTAEDCIQACTDYPNGECKRAIWRPTGSTVSCYLRKWNNVACTPTTTDPYGWNSAHLVDEKCP